MQIDSDSFELYHRIELIIYQQIYIEQDFNLHSDWFVIVWKQILKWLGFAQIEFRSENFTKDI